MSVYEVFDKLQQEVEAAGSVPLTAKVMIDKDLFLDLLDELREMLPPEVIQAQKVLDNAELITNNAQAEAENVVAQAKRQAESIISEAQAKKEEIIELSSITKEARQKADELTKLTQQKVEALIKKAKVDAYKIRAGSLEQSYEIMGEAVSSLNEASQILDAYKLQIERSKESLIASVKKKDEE